MGTGGYVFIEHLLCPSTVMNTSRYSLNLKKKKQSYEEGTIPIPILRMGKLTFPRIPS